MKTELAWLRRGLNIEMLEFGHRAAMIITHPGLQK